MDTSELPIDHLLYPVVFFRANTFEVWRDSSAARAAGPGILVDREGRAYQVLRSVSPLERAGPTLTRAEVRQLAGEGSTLLCEGERSLMSVADLRQRIVWLVSAQGDFESAEGFGLPSSMATATTVSELLEILIGAGFR